jgi:hypothetical protein
VLVRSVVQALGGLLAWIGVYLVAGSGAWDEGPMQRGWHDKAARTAVLRASYLSGRRRPADEAAAAVGLGLGRPTVASDPVAGAVAGSGGPGSGGAALAGAALAGAALGGAVPGPRRPGGVITSVPGMPAPDGAPAPAGVPAIETPEPVAQRAPLGGAPAIAAPEPVVVVPAPIEQPPTVPDAPVLTVPEPHAPEVVVPEPHLPEVYPPELVVPEPHPTEALAPSPIEPLPERSVSEVLPAAPALPEPLSVPEPEPFVPLPDIPDSTIPTLSLPGDLEHTRVAGWSRPQATGTGAELRLSFDTGERLDVTGPGLVGRNPVADEDEWTHLVAIDDPDHSVSKTHLAFWPEGDRLVVTDRGSTNGTVMLDPSGVRWALMPGERVVVAAGWALVLGQRTVRVEAR